MIVKLMKFFKNEKGSILVMSAILLPIILAFTGIAFDFGRWYLEKGQLQHAADSASTAGLISMKQHEHYVQGTGKFTDKIPLAAVRDDTLDDEFVALIKQKADEYIQINTNGRLKLGDGAEANIYRLVVEEDTHGTATKYTYYLEIILREMSHGTFSRIVYPNDMEIRAGSICKVDLEYVREILTYAKAREKFGRIANHPISELLAYDSAARLDADIEALQRMADAFYGLTPTEVKALLNGKGGSDISNNVLGHYEEVTGVSTYTKTMLDQDTFVKLLSGNENEIFDATQRYLFSDYATTNKDGLKIWLNYKDGAVYKVKIAINPADTANGSGPLVATKGYN